MRTTVPALNTREIETARRVALFSSDTGCGEQEGVSGVPGHVAVAELGGGRVALGVRGIVQVLSEDDAGALAALLAQRSPAVSVTTPPYRLAAG